MEVLSRIVGIGLPQRFVEGDQGLRIGRLEKYHVFKLSVFFKCHVESGVFGANGCEDFSSLIRLIGGYKWVKDGEVSRHLRERFGVVHLTQRIGKGLDWSWCSDKQRALEFHSGQSLACFL